jgi:anti-sigma factor RsiW
MNCRDIEPLLLAERDGVLTSEQHAALAKHVAACPACRQERLIYGEAVTFLKTDAANVPVPDADKEWRAIRSQLNGGARSSRKARLAPVIWFGAPLAAAAALAFAFFVNRPAPPIAETPDSTVAYVDQESGWLVVWAAEGDAKTSG